MSSIRGLSTVVLSASMVLAGCRAGGGEVVGYAELVEALRGAGVCVEPADQVEQDFLGPTGQVIRVNRADVQVFEYPDEATREAESSQIPSDGSSVGTTMITWVDQPNFWVRGRVIVLYVGHDSTVIDLLTGALGEPVFCRRSTIAAARTDGPFENPAECLLHPPHAD
ncbi:MAG: hypothetical protein AB1449_06380 [Chloroflexota bacterium]